MYVIALRGDPFLKETFMSFYRQDGRNTIIMDNLIICDSDIEEYHGIIAFRCYGDNNVVSDCKSPVVYCYGDRDEDLLARIIILLEMCSKYF
uniref:Uncharacterized protein n=1 Tax=Pithovirus LCPAC403 TaxID=2506596 RepID=A0A481ZCZ8_9VIRU|nr:MAG: hypothetical protein LCPAC403_01440 [Pithovirus LCPAC403]